MVNGGAFLDDGFAQLLGILRTHYEKENSEVTILEVMANFSYACLVYLVKEKKCRYC